MDDQMTLARVPGKTRGRTAKAMARLAAFSAIVTLGMTACGGGSAGPSSSASTRADTGGSVTSSQSADSSVPDTAADDSSADSDGGHSGQDAALTSEAICSSITVESVAEATALDITGLEPSESSTPQCSINYSTGDGPDSNITVAATRVTESDRESMSDAYDSAVRINRAAAGGDDASEHDLDAGDEAVHISGNGMDLGVMRVDSTLVTVIVPADAISADRFESLMATLGQAFA